MNKTFKMTSIGLAVMAINGAAVAQLRIDGDTSGVGANDTIFNNGGASVYIVGNNDNNPDDGEGVYIRSQGNADNNTGAYIYTQGRQNRLQAGAAGGSNEIRGETNNITGVTNVNTTGNAATNIGNAAAAVNVSGTTSINTGAGNANATNINTVGTGNVTIGNNSAPANTTRIQSSQNIITGASNQITATGANTIGGASNAINATGNNTMTAGGNNAITATGNNNISATIDNDVRATRDNLISATRNNAISAAANNTMTAAGNNTIAATGANSINAITAPTNNMTATTANNIQGPVNNIGTSAASVNSIGNTNTATRVTATAGNASQALVNNSANTLVSGGTSGLTARTGTANQTTNAQVLLSNAGGTTVDANGKILTQGAQGYTAPTAPTAAVTLTNGYGNTHGLVVTESQATLSGGTQSSSLTLNDRHARFSNAATGAPITVTGVADGRDDFDAVNVRQFAAAVAAVSAQANIPGLQHNQDRSIGVGLGNFMGKSALALGMNYRSESRTVFRVTVSSGVDGGAKPVVGAGASWAF